MLRKKKNRSNQSISYSYTANRASRVKRITSEYVSYLTHFEPDIGLNLLKNLGKFTLKDVETLMIIQTSSNTNETKRKKAALEEKRKEHEKKILEQLKRSQR